MKSHGLTGVRNPIGHLCYWLYISCKNNIGKALHYQTDLSDSYQLYIICKNNIETAIPYPTDMKP